MAVIRRLRKNRYWLVNGDNYELHFTPFYNESVILQFTQDKDNPNDYNYSSDFLNVENDILEANSINEAMEEFEDMIAEYIRDEISYYKNILENFNEN